MQAIWMPWGRSEPRRVGRVGWHWRRLRAVQADLESGEGVRQRRAALRDAASGYSRRRRAPGPRVLYRRWRRRARRRQPA
jgi:hypothetical protein